MELHYSKTYGNLWRCVLNENHKSLVPFIEPNDLETVEAREIYYCDPHLDIEHDKVIRVFSNSRDQLAVMIPYDVYMQMCGFNGIWYSEGNFKFDVVEIYEGKKGVILLNHEIEGKWSVIEIICPDRINLRPITVMRTLGEGDSKLEALSVSGLDINTLNKIYPVYNIFDSNKCCRYTPDNLTTLYDKEIFVFGSNPAGMHNGSAAKYAKDNFGAIQGKGEGLQGQSYAIPTTQGGLKELKKHVDAFIDFAIDNPWYTFLVTKIGCGNAGFKIKEVAPLFRFALGHSNIVLPKEFVEEMFYIRMIDRI